MSGQGLSIEEARIRDRVMAANAQQQLQTQANFQVSSPAFGSTPSVAPQNHRVASYISPYRATGRPRAPGSLTNHMTMGGNNARVNSAGEGAPCVFANTQGGVNRYRNESIVEQDFPPTYPSSLQPVGVRTTFAPSNAPSSFGSNPGPGTVGQGGLMNRFNDAFNFQTQSFHLPIPGYQSPYVAQTTGLASSNNLNHAKLGAGQVEKVSEENYPDSTIWVDDGSPEYLHYLSSINNQVQPAPRKQTVDPGLSSGTQSSLPTATEVDDQKLFDIVHAFVVRTRPQPPPNHSLPIAKGHAGDEPRQTPLATRPKTSPFRSVEATPVALPVELLDAIQNDSEVLGQTDEILNANVENDAETVKEAEARRDARELAAAEEAARLAALPAVDRFGHDFEHYARLDYERYQFEEILRMEKDVAERAKVHHNPPLNPQRYALALEDLSSDGLELVNNRIGMTPNRFQEAMEWLDQLIPREGVFDRDLEPLN